MYVNIYIYIHMYIFMGISSFPSIKLLTIYSLTNQINITVGSLINQMNLRVYSLRTLKISIQNRSVCIYTLY